MLKKLGLCLVLLCSCSSTPSSESGKDSKSSVRVPAQTPPDGTADHNDSDDACATVRLAPDGQCDPNGPYVACDPDCQEPPVDGAAGAPFMPSICDTVVYPDGVCDPSVPEAICDPDCQNPPGEDPPVDDPCANVRIAPDGQCDPNGTYAACDPDCQPVDPPFGNEAGAANDPCAAIDPIPDGQCNPDEPCDPDCLKK